MKLLFDQNLSPHLIERLTSLYPGSTHTMTIGLGKALDSEIWQYAQKNQLIIVTKDADFNELSTVWGSPPKVIWLRRGNCSTKTIETLLQDNHQVVKAFNEDDETNTLVLF
jgi:predicted nuclease of predicted toxin-antitoxin system